MQPKDLDIAIAEARRFIERAELAKHAFAWHEFSGGKGRDYFINEDTKATAAVKRASMDLTRSLVAIRAPSQ